MADLHWIEQLDQDSELVRVGCVASRYVFRVTSHGDRSWKLERRDAATNTWHRTPPHTWWKSPEGAKRAAETLWAREQPSEVQK